RVISIFYISGSGFIMVDVRNIQTASLIEKVSEELQKDDRIKVPEWVDILKAGIHKEKSWTQPDWYHRRLASTLRKVYLNGPIGTSKLSAEYGGRVDRGSKKYHPARGSRFIVRHMLEELERLGYVKKDQKGRTISPKGESFLTKVSTEIVKNMAEKDEKFKKFM
ncbi:30S ribosomal protein S19e, partial [mine drainage metagenome]